MKQIVYRKFNKIIYNKDYLTQKKISHINNLKLGV